ncbi:MAG: hypothetical protein K0U74_02095 [Alphaproteobacteria bacterium]|nr:hypothetical protein [Alphaproteobacteria bacterium]
MKLYRKNLRQFSASESGTILVKFALALPILLGISLSAMDYAWTLSHKTVLQDAADTAALAGAKELSLSDSKRENVSAVVKAMAKRYIEANRDSLAKKNAAPPTINANVTGDPPEVRVSITQKVDALVGGGFGLKFGDLKIRSVARVIGQPNICVLGLHPSANGTLSLEHEARVTGRNCAVYSNSSHTNAIKAKNSANLTATFICSRGGKTGGPGNFNPTPMTDCPGFDDPLSGRVEPQPGNCTKLVPIIQGVGGTLLPGTYCGGLTLEAGTQVVLTPGTYIFKDGPLIVKDGASLTGVNVGLYFVGNGANFKFEPKTLISLTAPISGEMAGLLIFESRSRPEGEKFELLSNNALVLLGTIYIPRGELHIDADSPIASDSAYTAIVARTMRLYGGPHLVLNTDYDKTDIPVPKGIRGAGQPVALAE